MRRLKRRIMKCTAAGVALAAAITVGAPLFGAVNVMADEVVTDVEETSDSVDESGKDTEETTTESVTVSDDENNGTSSELSNLPENEEESKSESVDTFSDVEKISDNAEIIDDESLTTFADTESKEKSKEIAEDNVKAAVQNQNEDAGLLTSLNIDKISLVPGDTLKVTATSEMVDNIYSAKIIVGSGDGYENIKTADCKIKLNI